MHLLVSLVLPPQAGWNAMFDSSNTEGYRPRLTSTLPHQVQRHREGSDGLCMTQIPTSQVPQR